MDELPPEIVYDILFGSGTLGPADIRAVSESSPRFASMLRDEYFLTPWRAGTGLRNCLAHRWWRAAAMALSRQPCDPVTFEVGSRINDDDPLWSPVEPMFVVDPLAATMLLLAEQTPLLRSMVDTPDARAAEEGAMVVLASTVMRMINDPESTYGPTDNDAMSLALYLSAAGSLSVTRVILEHANVDPAYRQSLVLNAAALSGMGELVEDILAHPRVSAMDGRGRAFKACARSDNVAGLRALIDAAAGSMMGSIISETFVEAAKHGATGMLEYLLGAADELGLDVAEHGAKALLSACVHNSMRTVKILVKDPRVSFDLKHPDPLLCRVARTNSSDVLSLLLAHGELDVGARDSCVLRCAAKACAADAVELLLQHEAVDPGARDDEALHSAIAASHKRTVRILLADPRVDPGSRDQWAICEAARLGNASIVRNLLEHPSVVADARNGLPATLARQGRDWDVLALLEPSAPELAKAKGPGSPSPQPKKAFKVVFKRRHT